MKKSVLLLLLGLAAGFPVLQAKVDYNAMEVEMTMNRGEYNALLDRFEKADTALSNADVANVYFGYTMTPEYDPRDSYSEISDAIRDKRYREAAAMADSALVYNPVSLQLLLLDLKANELRSDKNLEDILRNRRISLRCDMVANAIIESGRGTNAADPFYVISEADMMCFLNNVMCVDKILGRAKVGDIDAVKINLPGSDRMHILYFNNTREKKYLDNHSKPL